VPNSTRKMELKVIIKIAAREASEFSLDLSYIIPGANWRSIYQIRVESTEEACVLVYQGIIRNATGENWENVNVTLSTAEPSKGGEPPRIPTLVVQLTESKPQTYIYNSYDYDNRPREIEEVYIDDYESFSGSEEEEMQEVKRKNSIIEKRS